MFEDFLPLLWKFLGRKLSLSRSLTSIYALQLNQGIADICRFHLNQSRLCHKLCVSHITVVNI